MIVFDLHCHSTASDGLLPPAELVRRASARGARTLALTDHDDIGGLAEARETAVETGVRLVDGVELSVSWRDHTLHVVGLQIDPGSPKLATGMEGIRRGRDARARQIGDALARAGIPGAYEGALAFVTSERIVSRTHFARFLVGQGYARGMKDVFRRYLTAGKPGYVRHQWATLPQSIDWIHAAGGQAVLAHPGRYPLSKAALRELLGQFRDVGGDGVEVLTASHTPEQASQFANHARYYGFRASAGSDFHGPDESWLDLGALPALPDDLVPVWRDW
jgi:3',5'-nucleoside bisphosphate phosphatase